MECSKTFLPEFGDSEPCELKSTDCVIYEKAIPYLGLQKNATSTDVIEALLSSLIDARNRIKQLENTI